MIHSEHFDKSMLTDLGLQTMPTTERISAQTNPSQSEMRKAVANWPELESIAGYPVWQIKRHSQVRIPAIECFEYCATAWRVWLWKTKQHALVTKLEINKVLDFASMSHPVDSHWVIRIPDCFTSPVAMARGRSGHGLRHTLSLGLDVVKINIDCFKGTSPAFALDKKCEFTTIISQVGNSLRKSD
jgi:hypothetical protein